MANPIIAEAPCLRCGTVLTWKRDKNGRPYAWCTKRGGCGAVITLGGADPFPDSLNAPRGGERTGNTPAPDEPCTARPAPAPTPEPEPDDDGRQRDPEPEPKPGNPWGLFGD